MTIVLPQRICAVISLVCSLYIFTFYSLDSRTWHHAPGLCLDHNAQLDEKKLLVDLDLMVLQRWRHHQNFDSIATKNLFIDLPVQTRYYDTTNHDDWNVFLNKFYDKFHSSEDKFVNTKGQPIMLTLCRRSWKIRYSVSLACQIVKMSTQTRMRLFHRKQMSR